jgi:hypothetical protein
MEGVEGTRITREFFKEKMKKVVETLSEVRYI